MKGVGSYNDWPYYSSSSNLSAFAPPFTVNKSSSNDVSAPVVDLAESENAITSNHVPVCSYGYDSFANPLRKLDSTPFSKPYGYGYSSLQVIDPPGTQLPQFGSTGLGSKDAFTYDHCCDSVKLSVLEAQPYYPPTVSSQVHDANCSAASNIWSSSSVFCPLDWSSLNQYAAKSCEREPRLWNRFGELNQSKSKEVEVGSSFCPKETNITGLTPKEIFVNQGCQDIKGSKQMNWEKHGEPIIVNQLDDKSCGGQASKSLPLDFSSTSVHGTPLMSQETHCEPFLKSVVDSAPITVVVKNSNIGNGTADGERDKNNFSNLKEAYPLHISGGSVCSGLGQLSMHLDEPTSSNNAMVSSWNVSRDVVDYVFKARPGTENPDANPDNLSLSYSANEGVNSVEKFLDSVDQCNPVVDSPCWKGAPVAGFSPFEASEAFNPEFVKKYDELYGSNLQQAQNFPPDTDNSVKISCEMSNKNQVQNEFDCREKGLTGSPIKFSVTNFASGDYNSDGAVNAGPFQSKPSSDYGLPYLDGISETREHSVPLNNSIFDFKSRPSNAKQQTIEENKFMSQKQHSLYRGCADGGCNQNECLECSTSPAAEHGLSSPSSIVDAPTELKTSAKKVSTPKLNIQMLVKMMHNMSELLLDHCRSDACEMHEQDRSVLENVISNLCTCALKNDEQIIPAQKRGFPLSNSDKRDGESPRVQQNASFERAHLTKVELENLPVKDMENHYFAFGKEYGKLSDSSRTRDNDIEMKKADKMTKAIKRILSENFRDEDGPGSQTLLYKNLWLEAEAALSSINYRARYNQMMIEMEKYSCKKRDNSLNKGEQSKLEVDPKLSPSQSSATEVNCFHSAQDLPVLNAANLKEPSVLKFSPDLNKRITLTLEGSGVQNVHNFIPDSSVFDINKEAGDYEASVMARLHVLESRDDWSCINTANLEGLSSSVASNALDIAPKSASGGTDSQKTQNQVSFSLDSPIPAKEPASDLEASVMARFHILQSRVEDSNSMSSEGPLLKGIGFAGNGSDALESESLYVSTNPLMPFSSFTAVDKSSLKEFDMELEDDQEIQPRSTYRFGNKLPTDHSDGFSSDWEHVKKEEIAGQTC